jgi:methylated-DNA-[protein]-cysteine S-methyltransferase
LFVSILRKIVIHSPLGRLGIGLSGEQVHRLEYLEKTAPLEKPGDRFAVEVVRQLDAYFADANFRFDLPIVFSGTEFQNKVWSMLRKLECGQTATYGEIADKLASGPRAVGNACRRNPVPILVPCHRVVARNSIGGYSGHTEGYLLDKKKWLLWHEGVFTG